MMSDPKKKLNITVKKTTSPYLFPDNNENNSNNSSSNSSSSSINVNVNEAINNNNSRVISNNNMNNTNNGNNGNINDNSNHNNNNNNNNNGNNNSSNNNNNSDNSNNSNNNISNNGNEQIPEKRKRGRPRLNPENSVKKQQQKLVDTDKKNENQESIESDQNSDNNNNNDSNNDNSNINPTNILKKRGRKPKNQNIAFNANDRVYGLSGVSTTSLNLVQTRAIDLENLENLSYIVNLKISKEKAEEIIQEVRLNEKFGNNGSEHISNEHNISNNKKVLTSLTDALMLKQEKEIIVKEEMETVRITDKTKAEKAEKAERAVNKFFSSSVNSNDNDNNNERCSTCSKCQCNTNANANANNKMVRPSDLLAYEQVNIDVLDQKDCGVGYLDCYISDLMPDFIEKDETGCERWPLTSKYPCRNCEEMFTTTPAGLIQKIFGDYEVDPMKCKFFLYLNFCNWSCAARYSYDRMHDWVNQHNMINLCYNTIMKKIDSSHTWKKVEMAPELGNLKRNGGELTIEQYRELTKTNITYTIYLTPLIPLKMTLEETSGANTNRHKKSDFNNKSSKDKVVLLDKSRIIKAEQSIKSRKDSNKGNTIDRLMKVEVK